MDFSLTPEMEEIVRLRIGDRLVAEYFDFDVRFIQPVQPTPTWDLKKATSVEEIDSHPWLDLAAPNRYEEMAVEIARLQSEGYPTLTGGPNFFESFWGLRGMEQLLCEMAEGSQMAIRLFERLGEAEVLAADGIDAEVIDLRSLVPMDFEAIRESVQKTGHLVIVEEGPRRGGIGAEIAARAAEELAEDMLAPVCRVAAPDIPPPFSPPMERFYRPDAARIAEAARRTVAYGE